MSEITEVKGEKGLCIETVNTIFSADCLEELLNHSTESLVTLVNEGMCAVALKKLTPETDAKKMVFNLCSQFYSMKFKSPLLQEIATVAKTIILDRGKSCSAILKSGPREGKRCAMLVLEGDFCPLCTMLKEAEEELAEILLKIK